MSLRQSFQNPKTRRLLFAGFLAFIVIGALQAMYGPAFLMLQARYELGPAQVSLIVSMHFFGSLTTILLSGLLIARFGYRPLLLVAALALSIGCLGIAFSPSWTLTLAFTLLAGLGFGLMDIGTNLLFARSFEPKSAPALNLLNAMFGLGAVIGPLLVVRLAPLLISIFGDLSWLSLLPIYSYAFIFIAVLAAITSFLISGISELAPVEQASGRGVFRWWSFIGFVSMYFLYVGAEVGAASWETSHLAPYYGETRAAFFTSLYWAALTLGRFIATPISAYIKPGNLILWSTVLSLIGVALTHNVTLAPYAYALAGLAFAPLFPTGLAWLQEEFPNRAEQLAPFVIAAANLGAVVMSPVVGLVIDVTSSDSVPTSITTMTMLLLFITIALWDALQQE